MTHQQGGPAPSGGLLTIFRRSSRALLHLLLSPLDPKSEPVVLTSLKVFKRTHRHIPSPSCQFPHRAWTDLYMAWFATIGLFCCFSAHQAARLVAGTLSLARLSFSVYLAVPAAALLVSKTRLPLVCGFAKAAALPLCKQDLVGVLLSLAKLPVLMYNGSRRPSA